MPTSRETGLAILEVTTTADRLPVVTSRLSENGSLVSLTAVVGTGEPAKGQLFLEAGIMRTQEGNLFKIAVLVKGYLAFGSTLNWFGSTPLDPTDRLYLECRGAGVYIVRLNALVLHERAE